MKEKNIKPRVLFASQSVHEKQVGSEEDKAELILQDRLKRRDNGHIEQAKTSGLCEPDPSLSSNVKESCGHADSLGKSISPLNTKIPPDDGQVSHNSSASTVNNEHLPKVEAKIDTTRLSADVPKTGKPYEVKWDEQIKQARTGVLCEPDPSLSLNGKGRCRHVHSQGKSISPSNAKVLLGDGQVAQNRSTSTRNSELSLKGEAKIDTTMLSADVTKTGKSYEVKWDEQIKQAKTGVLCEPHPSLSLNSKERCRHVHSQGKSISPSNTKVLLGDGQVAQNRSTSTRNSELSLKGEAKIDTTMLSADVTKTGKSYEVKWDEQIKQAKTGVLCEPHPSLSLNSKERCRHVHSQGKSISPSNTKVLLGDGQVSQNRSASTRNSELSPELNSKVGTICLPVDVTKREKPYQVKWDAKISRTPCERFSYFLTLRDVESNSHVSSEHGSSFVTFLPIGGHTCRQGQSQENLSSTTTTTNTSLCQTLQTNDCHTDKVEHKAPESSQNTSAPDNGEVDEIELMDLSWDNSDCFSGNSAGSRESSPLELIKEVSCSSDNSIGKSERKMRSSRKKAVKSHKREVVNFHCNNCDVSNDAAHLSKTQSSTEKNGKFPIQKPVTCNHKNSDANDVVAQASKSEVHCILCGIRLSKPQCFYSLGSLCTDDDICETTSDDINRHLVSDVDTNPPAGDSKGHPDTGYTSSEELENESVLPKEVEAILTHKRRRTDGYDGDHESDSSFESFVFTLSSSEDEREAVSVKEYVKQETNKRQEMAISQTIEKVCMPCLKF